jgi:hypothetical protein
VNTTQPRSGYKAYPALKRSFRLNRAARAEALAAVTDVPPPPPPRPDPTRAFAGIEEQTDVFRRAIANEHQAKIVEIRRAERLALEEWTDVLAGEAPPAPCKNVTWERGAKRPPSKWHETQRVRCSSKHPETRGRCGLIAGHEGDHRASKFRVPCACAPCVLHDARGAKQWHEGRKNGQRDRFPRVRACESRMLIAGCGVCGSERKPMPEGCGVRRVCPKCDVRQAVQRRSRFGRARARAMVTGFRYGLTRTQRRSGRFTEKMYTVSLPHGPDTYARISGEVRAVARDELHARVAAIYLAWPLFQRKINAHWRARKVRHVAYHRAFEWTVAKDKGEKWAALGKTDDHGHPHFHVYLWSPYLEQKLLRVWWAEALRSVGWPVDEASDGGPMVKIQIHRLKSFDVRAARELMKGGDRRKALTFSRVEFANPRHGANLRRGKHAGPGIDAYKYAEGWNLQEVSECPVDVQARLYMALESHHMSQASSRFFLDDESPRCECCETVGGFRVRVAIPCVELPRVAGVVSCAPYVAPWTGPPPWWERPAAAI